MTNTSLKTERAAEAVAQHIEALILEGSLRPDERLLPERELAERLDVSRSTLRDGLKLLEERGLLTSGNGRGSRVARLGTGTISDPLSAILARHAEGADDYLEFRAIAEAAAAGLAATRATDIERERLAACLVRMDLAHEADDPTAEADADAEMHLLIYEASHNLTLLQIMQALAGVLRNDVAQNRNRLFSIPAIRELLREQHRAIAGAIIARDATLAETAARDHIAYLRRAMREIREASDRLDLSLRRLHGGGVAIRARDSAAETPDTQDLPTVDQGL